MRGGLGCSKHQPQDPAFLTHAPKVGGRDREGGGSQAELEGECETNDGVHPVPIHHPLGGREVMEIYLTQIV